MKTLTRTPWKAVSCLLASVSITNVLKIHVKNNNVIGLMHVPVCHGQNIPRSLSPIIREKVNVRFDDCRTYALL